METETEEKEVVKLPENQGANRDSSTGRWVKGMSGNIMGRPRGKTMKEWVREYLARMTDEERDAWVAGLPKTVIWRMAEGNPESKTDLSVRQSGEYKEKSDAELLEIINGNNTTTGIEEGDGEA